MPTKNATASTAAEGAWPKASKQAHSTATWKPHHISAPSTAGLPARSRPRASRTPRPTGPTIRRTRPSPGAMNCAAATSAITVPPRIAGTTVMANEPPPGSTPGVEPEAAEQQHGHVDAVEQDVEGDHPRADVGALHAGAAHRPRGQRDPAGAGAGEQARRGVGGEVDLERGAQADAALAAAAGDAREQDHVAGEGEHREQQRQREPAVAAVAQALPGRRQVGERRREQHERHHEQHRRPHEERRLAGGDAAEGEGVLGGRFGGGGDGDGHGRNTRRHGSTAQAGDPPVCTVRLTRPNPRSGDPAAVGRPAEPLRAPRGDVRPPRAAVRASGLEAALCCAARGRGGGPRAARAPSAP